jgi:hypothetical protein
MPRCTIPPAGRDLLRSTARNFSAVGNPNFDHVFAADNTATSDYEALQPKFQRRWTKSLQVLASYTYSHLIDSSSIDLVRLPGSARVLLKPNVDREDFDIRHSFTSGLVYNLPVLGTPRRSVRFCKTGR